jgi:hypothetical protein
MPSCRIYEPLYGGAVTAIPSYQFTQPNLSRRHCAQPVAWHCWTSVEPSIVFWDFSLQTHEAPFSRESNEQHRFSSWTGMQDFAAAIYALKQMAACRSGVRPPRGAVNVKFNRQLLLSVELIQNR